MFSEVSDFLDLHLDEAKASSSVRVALAVSRGSIGAVPSQVALSRP